MLKRDQGELALPCSTIRPGAGARLAAGPARPVIPPSLLEDVAHDGQRRENIRPARAETELRQNLGGFGPRQAAVHRPVEPERHVDLPAEIRALTVTTAALPRNTPSPHSSP
jgi:hypothetical protein